MSQQVVDLLSDVTDSNAYKKVSYVSTVFEQNVILNANGDFDVSDQDYNISYLLSIPMHSFESFIDVLINLRKTFNVACAYSKEPITHENNPYNNADTKGDKNYTFVYWNLVHRNLLYSNSKGYNVFMYIREFEQYANLYVYKRSLV